MPVRLAVRRVAQVGVSIAMPALLIIPIWLGFEVQLARQQVDDNGLSAATESASRIEDLLLRFDRATAALRSADALGDPALLAGRLLRTEIALAPVEGLLLANARGRIVSSTIPTSGSEAPNAWWLGAGRAAPSGAAMLVGPGTSPYNSGQVYSLLRRTMDGDSTRIILAAFLSRDRLLAVARPSILPEGAVLSIDAFRASADPVPQVTASSKAWFTPDPIRIEAARGALTITVTPKSDAVTEILGKGISRDGSVACFLVVTLTAFSVIGRWPRKEGKPQEALASDIDRDGRNDLARAEAAEAHLVAALDERDRILAAVGHDVRSPLNAIQGLVALLLDGDLEEAQRRYLLQVRASCEVLLAMLNGMLEAATHAGNSRELYLERIDIPEIVAEVAEVFRPVANEKGVELNFECVGILERTWQGDATRIRQIACNLIGNAVKYTDQGSIRISMDRSCDGLLLSVADTGPGIAPDERDQIFQRFRRGRAEVAEGREGLGLGLALCSEIASLMGGSLAVESEVGLGSTFRFSFPATAVEVAPTRLPLRGRSALVVGLSEGLRRQTVQVLERLGGTVDAAGDGFVGLGLAERIAHESAGLDLVVLDAALKGLPAEAVLARLRSSRMYGGAKVLLIGDDGQAWPGVAALLAHPVDDRVLASSVTRLFSDGEERSDTDDTVLASVSQRILVVDDSSANRMLLTDAMRRADFTVFAAKDGEEAVSAVSRGGFDAVVMDVQMPGIDGIEATRRIRSIFPGKSPPIIVLTAHTGAKVRHACLGAGAVAVLHKPINMTRLPSQVTEAIEQSRQATSLALSDGALNHDGTTEDALETTWFGAFLLEHGPARTQVLIEQFLMEGVKRLDRIEELLTADQWETVSKSLQDFHSVAEEIGACKLAEALELIMAAVTVQARQSGSDALMKARATWYRTVPSLQRQMTRLLGNTASERRVA